MTCTLICKVFQSLLNPLTAYLLIQNPGYISFLPHITVYNVKVNDIFTFASSSFCQNARHREDSKRQFPDRRKYT
jgi:hypothetical protein